MGILRIQSVNIGHQDQKICADECCHDRRKPVIITELDFVGGNRIVFVDDRHCSQSQKLLKGILGIDPGILIRHGILCQKHLRRNVVVLRKEPLVHHHEAGLSYRRVSLLFRNGLRAFLTAKNLPSGRDGTGGNQYYVFSLSLQIADHTDQLFNLKEIQFPGIFMGQGRRTDLDNNPFFIL